MTDLQVLEKARALIADPRHWTQGAYARDKWSREVHVEDGRAVKFCAMGAYWRCATQLRQWGACQWLRLAGSDFGALTLANDGVMNEWDDAPDLTRKQAHAAVLAIYDKAIELARAEG